MNNRKTRLAALGVIVCAVILLSAEVSAGSPPPPAGSAGILAYLHTQSSDPSPSTVAQWDQRFREEADRAPNRPAYVDLSVAYTERWKTMAQEYLTRLLEICDPDMREEILATQEAWERYASLYIEELSDHSEYIAMGGTAADDFFFDGCYALYRDRAATLEQRCRETEEANRQYAEDPPPYDFVK